MDAKRPSVAQPLSPNLHRRTQGAAPHDLVRELDAWLMMNFPQIEFPKHHSSVSAIAFFASPFPFAYRRVGLGRYSYRFQSREPPFSNPPLSRHYRGSLPSLHVGVGTEDASREEEHSLMIERLQPAYTIGCGPEAVVEVWKKLLFLQPSYVHRLHI